MSETIKYKKDGKIKTGKLANFTVEGGIARWHLVNGDVALEIIEDKAPKDENPRDIPTEEEIAKNITDEELDNAEKLTEEDSVQVPEAEETVDEKKYDEAERDSEPEENIADETPDVVEPVEEAEEPVEDAQETNEPVVDWRKMNFFALKKYAEEQGMDILVNTKKVDIEAYFEKREG